MRESEAVREREREPYINYYEQAMARLRQTREQLAGGRVVIKGKEIEWFNARQGRFRMLITNEDWEEGRTCVPYWTVFIHDIRTSPDGITTSGEHQHQGGVGLFAIEGDGYIMEDGERYDWKAGDLIMIPIQPGGVVHQHFSRRPNDPAKWVAFFWQPFTMLFGSRMEQHKTGSLVER